MFNPDQNCVGSKFLAIDLGISTRLANKLRKSADFPPVMWIGREWRVDREAYEAWKVLRYNKKGAK